MKQMTIAALIMLLATSAVAVLDPTPDTIGIYLDSEAEEMCVQGLVDGMTDFTFYMIITNPTFTSMRGYLAGYHFEGIAGLNSGEFAHAGAMDSGSLGDHLVNFESPVPISGNTLLMTISATYFSFEYDPARLLLHGIMLANKNDSVPGVIDGDGTMIDMHVTDENGVTIRINGDCEIVATDNRSFDGIKSLYR